MFEFPTAPAVGDDYTIGGIVYTWTGTNWDIHGGGDPGDYVLKAGDVMTGPLGFGTATYNIASGTNTITYNAPAAALHSFTVDGVQKARIEAGGVVLPTTTLTIQGQNRRAIQLDNCWIQQGNGAGQEGRIELWTDNGGYSSVKCMETTIQSGQAGIRTGGRSFFGGVDINGANHINIPTDGYGIQFNSGGYVYKKIGTGMTLRKHTGNTQWGIENNDGGGRVNIATTTLLATVEDQIEERVAPLLARIVQLETEIVTLKAQPRAPTGGRR